MKKSVLLVLFTFAIVVSVGVARADTVHLNFISAGPNSSFGEAVYPYYLAFDDGNYIDMMCDSLDHFINNGDSWNANRLWLADLNDSNLQGLMYGSTHTMQDYLAAGYLYYEEWQAFRGGNLDPQGMYNWAAWDIFDPTDVQAKLDPVTLALVQGLMTDAQFTVHDKQPGDLYWTSMMFVYTPTGNVGQEFFGPTPEPGTLVLYGSGVVALASALRRKFHL